MILVTGAAGKTGRAVLRALVKRGEPLRAFLHRPEQVPLIETAGHIETISGDLREPRLVHQAMQGVRAVYHIAPNVSPDEVTIGQTVIAAAQAAKVEHFVFHSVLHPHVEAMPHHWLKARVEELIFASGLSFTILQPTAYMQNLLGYWEQILTTGQYVIPYSPETRLSLVDLEDVAEAAAIVLSHDRYHQASIELVGTTALSQWEVANVLSEQLGRPITAQAISLDAWQQRAHQSGLSEYAIQALSAMFRYYENHGLSGNPFSLGCLLGRSPASLADFVKRTMSERTQ